jgi:hypothetical protein
MGRRPRPIPSLNCTPDRADLLFCPVAHPATGPRTRRLDATRGVRVASAHGPARSLRPRAHRSRYRLCKARSSPRFGWLDAISVRLNQAVGCDAAAESRWRCRRETPEISETLRPLGGAPERGGRGPSVLRRDSRGVGVRSSTPAAVVVPDYWLSCGRDSELSGTTGLGWLRSEGEGLAVW